MPDDLEILSAHLSDTYSVERELGGGGMSSVFLATELKLERKVVIKVLRDDIAAGIRGDRFKREVLTVAKLQHPHIVPLLSSGEVAGKPYFTMPLIEGESLGSRIKRDGELPVVDSIRILRDIASALAYAHRNGVVHRDIKPDNVMLEDEYALVTDFGVAKALSNATVPASSGSITGTGLAIGTPSYMAPEQAMADPAVDHRADIYAFGVVAYEMLSGSPPFTGRTAQAVLAAHAIETPEHISKRRPHLPPWLADLVMRCLEKRPADRPQSATELLQELQALEHASTGGTPRALSQRERWIRWAAAASVIAALAVAAYLFVIRGDRGSTPPGEIRSVAVLPLVNVGGSEQDEYFSDGMTDEIASALSRIPGLRVASRTSAHTFKGRKDVAVADIGRALNVQAVLEGTVRRSGGRLRVTGQLTSADDGLSLWADTYERDASDVFAVQDDIARAIVSALQVRLTASDSASDRTVSGTKNLQAYDSYLRGRYFWNARGADNLRRAISYFDRALEADPVFARAYASRAIAWALLPQYTDESPTDALEKTRADARRALALDTTLAEAHTALGLAAVNTWDWDTAEKSYRRAIALDPRYATAHQWYGEFLYTTSRLDSSVAETRKALELDPLAPIVPAALGYALFVSRRYPESLAEFRRGTDLAPNIGLFHALASFAHLFAGDPDNARREMEIAARADPELILRQGQLAYVYAMTGDEAKAREVLREMGRRGVVEAQHPVAFALAHLALGDRDKSLDLLEQGVARRDIGLLTAASPLDDPVYDSIRGDPRFQRMIERMGLARFKRQP